MEHPISRASLERFIAGAATREERRAVVAHLLKGCARCAGILRELERRQQPVGAYDRVLDRFEPALPGDVASPAGAPTVLPEALEEHAGSLVDQAVPARR